MEIDELSKEEYEKMAKALRQVGNILTELPEEARQRLVKALVVLYEER